MESEEQKPKDIVLNGEVKQEMEDFLENVKKEPIDDEYSRHLVPKFEENSEPSASYLQQAIHLKNTVQMIFMQTQTVDPKIEVEPERDQEELHAESQNNNMVVDSQYHRCSVCSKNCPLENMKYVAIEEDILVTMIGCVLRGEYSLDQAQSFMSAGRKVYICYDHFSEAINKIYEVLNIKNAIEITWCSTELMRKLMITVNALIPQIETWHFSDIVRDFVRMFISRNLKRPYTKGEQNKSSEKHQNHRCSVCRREQSLKNLKQVTMQDEMLVIMIVCVLRGKYTLEMAQSFMSGRKTASICHVHFSQSKDEIYKFLDIKQPDGIWFCSTELIANLMVTVNKLCSWISATLFCHLFNTFVRRNKKILDKVMPSTKMDIEDQMPKDILLNGGEIKQETNDLSENIKKEPMNDEYFDQIVPKLEEKIEQPASNVGNQDCQAFFEKFRNERFESSKLVIPKQEKLIVKVKQEPFESSSSYVPYYSRKNRNNKGDPNRMGRYARCLVCSQSQNTRNMKYVTLEEEKLIMMVACVLRGDYTPHQAQQFMTQNTMGRICYIHLPEIFNEICDILYPKNLEEIATCSSKLMQNVMITVNSISPQTNASQFRCSLSKFALRNFEHKRTRSRFENGNYDAEFRCSVCFQMKISDRLKFMKFKDEKLAVMIGCMIRGDYNLKHAQSFLFDKNEVFVCYLHIADTINGIYDLLHITTPGEIILTSLESIKGVIETVQKVCPTIAISNFRNVLYYFVVRNVEHLSETV